MTNPWDNEPYLYKFDYRGMRCYIVRQSMGHLCGYVAVPKHHPDFGKPYDQMHEEHPDDELGHCELTYASSSEPTTKEDRKGAWFFGFDAAHCMDVIPSMAHVAMPGATYKGVKFMQRACERLADILVKDANNDREGMLRRGRYDNDNTRDGGVRSFS